MSASEPSRSEAIQHYLREIYRLEEVGRRATTTSVAEAMGVSAASASVMFQRLAALKLVEHIPYRGVVLTDEGRRAALEVVRHHRLLEQYLAETLGLPLDEVHEEADRLEHALSEELEARIDAFLGFPKHDPHGHPIPGADLELAPDERRTVLDLEPGEHATVKEVPDGEPDVLRYLTTLGLTPGKAIELRERAPFDGPLTLRCGGKLHAISHELAAAVAIL